MTDNTYPEAKDPESTAKPKDLDTIRAMGAMLGVGRVGEWGGAPMPERKRPFRQDKSPGAKARRRRKSNKSKQQKASRKRNRRA